LASANLTSKLPPFSIAQPAVQCTLVTGPAR
jgi:hypothetical protein